MHGLTTRDIRNTIKNAAGSKSALFVPDHAFEVLMQRQIKQLREPSLHCAESVYNELSILGLEIISAELSRFWKLNDAINAILVDVLSEQHQKTQEMINNAIELELAYINTSHPDFLGLELLTQKEPETINNKDFDDFQPKKAAAPSGGFFGFIFRGKAKEEPKQELRTQKTDLSDIDQLELTEREKTQITIIRKLLDSYLSVVKKNIQDQVTKIVMMVLVKGTLHRIKRQLTQSLYEGDNADYSSLLMEAEDVERKRNACKRDLDALQQARTVLQQAEFGATSE